ncbi:MAG: heavy metal translocating P-type ATPase metal-binding domain-containing protein [Flammeovirgaceae bacterium]|nr:heavy metal translocating P-type ATPase metal-binding domain-containing protein [Flammeovirgaceae bacterium]
MEKILEPLKTDKNLKCYHCGDDCDTHPIVVEEKAFCCQGCKTVYEILSDSNLDNYYNLEKNPGTKIPGNAQPYVVQSKYIILDNEDIQKQLVNFTDGKITSIQFFVPNIHCSSCIWLLENLHKLHPGVIKSVVNFPKKQVSITFRDAKISLREVVELLAGIGYAPEINLNPKKDEKQAGLPKSFYIKLGVAGFCFGNIMLLSIPEYLDSANAIDPEFKNYFSYLTFLLAIPVLLYSGNEYFTSAYTGLKQKYINIDVPISLGILTLFIRSAFEIISETGSGFIDSLAGLIFFLLIGKWYQNKTYSALSFDRDYASYFPVGVTIKIDNEEKVIPLKEVKIGDRLVVKNQDLIPADAILLHGIGNIDYSFVTGESEPVSKSLGENLYAGGRQIGAGIEVEIMKAVDNSYLTQLWNQEVFQKEEQSKISAIANNVSKYFTIIILGIALFTAAYWYFEDHSKIVNAVTAVLIVACPCALALSIPFTFGNTLRILGKQGFYLKNTEAIEELSKVNDIVLDKTGTLTETQTKSIEYLGEELSKEEEEAIKAVTYNSTHPLSKAITAFLSQSFEKEKVEEFEEITGKGLIGKYKKLVIKLGSEAYITGNKNQSESGTKVYVSIDNMYKGCFEFKASYRNGFGKVIEQLNENYSLHLLSGDNNKEKTFLSQYFSNEQQLNFNQSPLDKLVYIKALKDQDKKVLMIGDGLNDSGALKQSDIGISISDDIYNFSPACDAILQAQNFRNLHKIIRFSRVTIGVVIASFVLSFLYNIVGLSFAVSGMLTPLISAILMPLSSVTVVGFTIIATNLFGKLIFNKISFCW